MYLFVDGTRIRNTIQIVKALDSLSEGLKKTLTKAETENRIRQIEYVIQYTYELIPLQHETRSHVCETEHSEVQSQVLHESFTLDSAVSIAEAQNEFHVCNV